MAAKDGCGHGNSAMRFILLDPFCVRRRWRSAIAKRPHPSPLPRERGPNVTLSQRERGRLAGDVRIASKTRATASGGGPGGTGAWRSASAARSSRSSNCSSRRSSTCPTLNRRWPIPRQPGSTVLAIVAGRGAAARPRRWSSIATVRQSHDSSACPDNSGRKPRPDRPATRAKAARKRSANSLASASCLGSASWLTRLSGSTSASVRFR